MSRYKYCLVRFKEEIGKNYLFVAPNDWRIEAGIQCKVEGTSDIGTIINVISIDEVFPTEARTRDFIRQMNQDREIKKVVSIVTIDGLWEEE